MCILKPHTLFAQAEQVRRFGFSDAVWPQTIENKNKLQRGGRLGLGQVGKAGHCGGKHKGFNTHQIFSMVKHITKPTFHGPVLRTLFEASFLMHLFQIS